MLHRFLVCLNGYLTRCVRGTVQRGYCRPAAEHNENKYKNGESDAARHFHAGFNKIIGASRLWLGLSRRQNGLGSRLSFRSCRVVHRRRFVHLICWQFGHRHTGERLLILGWI